MYKYLFFCRCAIGQSSVSSEMERIFNKVSNNYSLDPGSNPNQYWVQGNVLFTWDAALKLSRSFPLCFFLNEQNIKPCYYSVCILGGYVWNNTCELGVHVTQMYRM